MGKVEGDFHNNTVLTELTQGLEWATELNKQLDPAEASELQTCDSLLEKILSSYDKVLELLENGDPSSQIASGEEGLDQSSITRGCGREDGSKKRKTFAKWSLQVKVGSGTTEFEGQAAAADGYSWRKYGQKNILGCNNPRAYYRCTHRKTQGCPATKQVQRAEEDPLVYEILYTGTHSCMQERMKQDKEHAKKQDDQIQRQSQKPRIANLKPDPDQEPNTNTDTSQDPVVPFSFPSTHNEDQNKEMKFLSKLGTRTGYSSPFLSPATSESYNFSFSQCNANGFGTGQGSISESDFGEIMSNSYADNPLGDWWDISVDDLDLDSLNDMI